VYADGNGGRSSASSISISILLVSESRFAADVLLHPSSSVADVFRGLQATETEVESRSVGVDGWVLGIPPPDRMSDLH
jgi:hypothetical protein